MPLVPTHVRSRTRRPAPRSSRHGCCAVRQPGIPRAHPHTSTTTSGGVPPHTLRTLRPEPAPPHPQRPDVVHQADIEAPLTHRARSPVSESAGRGAYDRLGHRRVIETKVGPDRPRRVAETIRAGALVVSATKWYWPGLTRFSHPITRATAQRSGSTWLISPGWSPGIWAPPVESALLELDLQVRNVTTRVKRAASRRSRQTAGAR